MSELTRRVNKILRYATKDKMEYILDNARFTERERTVFVLKYLKEKTNVAISLEINCAPSTLENCIYTIKVKVDSLGVKP